MGRPKLIPDKELLSLLDSFWIRECHGMASKLGAASFSQYLQNNGYPVSDSVIRHNKGVMAKIRTLRENGPSTPPAHPAPSGGTDAADMGLAEKYRELQNFFYDTYVNGVCCHLVNEELSLSMNSPVRPEAVRRDLITADTAPFTSPVVENLAKLFDFEESGEDKFNE